MTGAALCIALFAAGHMIRDGWPALGRTNFGARPAGAVLCGLGAVTIASPWIALLIGAAMLAGFPADQKHAEGQNARGWRDACYLALSGVTSLAPLACVAVYLDGWAGAAIVLVGLAKPPLWFGAWAIDPARWWPWAEPTRVAAMVFGALIGAAVAFVLQWGA